LKLKLKLKLKDESAAVIPNPDWACQVFNDTTGSYAAIPMDPSMGTGCTAWTVAGTCRPDACPANAIPMNISVRVHLTQWLLAGAEETSRKLRHPLAQLLNNPPLLLYGGGSTPEVPETQVHQHGLAPMGHARSGFRKFRSRMKHGLAPMGHGGLPHSVHLLSLRAVSTSAYLLRLQHLGDGESGQGESVRVSFFRAGLCGLLGVRSRVQEKSITALYDVREEGDTVNRKEDSWTADEAERLDSLGSSGAAEQARLEAATTEGAAQAPKDTAVASEVECRDLEVKIHPQDIRTFYVTLRR